MASLAVARAADAAPACLDRKGLPIDRDHLARYTFGNIELELEVLQLFAEHAPRYLDGLRSATSEKEWRDAAHTLKGSAGAVGAFHVAELAQGAEALAESADAAARQSVIGALDDAISEAQLHIAKLLASA